MNANQRIERAILVALIDNLGAAGFKVASVWTEESYVAQAADGTTLEISADYPITPMTLANVLKVFDEYDMCTPTVHFTHQHQLTWGNRGVMVVPGNGEDFISDWHCNDKAFDAIVESVSEAPYHVALFLDVLPAFDPLTAGRGEGWGLFTIDADDKLRMIQKDDEAGLFESDDQALAHVRAKAEAGSALHQAALEWVAASPAL